MNARGWILTTVTAVSMLVAPAQPCRGQELRLLLDTSYVNMLMPDRLDLEAGYVANDPSEGISAFRVLVDAPPAAGWALYAKAGNPYFSPQSLGKPCRDLKWKLDAEGANAFRPFTLQDQVVAARPSGGAFEGDLDLLLEVDWETAPAAYGLELVFTLVAE